MYWFFRPLIYIFIRLFYPFTVINKERADSSKPCIIVCNHLGGTDSFTVACCFKKKVFFLGKKEWFQKQPLSGFLKMMGGLPVDRENVDLNAIKQCLTTLKQGKQLCIFPEGTRNRTGEELLPLKSGVSMIAIKSKVDILPIFIYKKSKLFKRNYVAIGEKFSLEEFYGQKIDKTVCDQATNVVKDHILATKKELLDYLKEHKKIKSEH